MRLLLPKVGALTNTSYFGHLSCWTNLHETAYFSANFGTNCFIFGIQVHNFILKAQNKEKGGNVEVLLSEELI